MQYFDLYLFFLFLTILFYTLLLSSGKDIIIDYDSNGIIIDERSVPQYVFSFISNE